MTALNHVKRKFSFFGKYLIKFIKLTKMKIMIERPDANFYPEKEKEIKCEDVIKTFERILEEGQVPKPKKPPYSYDDFAQLMLSWRLAGKITRDIELHILEWCYDCTLWLYEHIVEYMEKRGCLKLELLSEIAEIMIERLGEKGLGEIYEDVLKEISPQTTAHIKNCEWCEDRLIKILSQFSSDWEALIAGIKNKDTVILKSLAGDKMAPRKFRILALKELQKLKEENKLPPKTVAWLKDIFKRVLQEEKDEDVHHAIEEFLQK